MFVLYAFLISAILTVFSLIFIKIYQLENYKIKKYFKKIVKNPIFRRDKNALNFTKRVKRLIFVVFLFNFLYFFVIFFFFLNIYFFISLYLTLCFRTWTE